MLLTSFLQNNVLVTNTYDIFDSAILTARLRSRYGAREVRDDITAAQVCENAQNVIDINHNYYSAIFAGVYDPYKTWSETGSSAGNVNGTSSDSNSSNTTLTRAGTIKNEGETNGTDETTSTTSTQTDTTADNSVYAYDSATSAHPESAATGHDEGSGNSTSNRTTGDTHTNTETINTTDTTTNSGSKSTTNGENREDNYTKSGFNIAEMSNAIDRYVSAYDIIIDDIVKAILKIVVDFPNVCKWGV